MLRKFCDIFPFAEAKYFLLHSIVDNTNGKFEKAAWEWKNSKTAAKKYSLLYELGVFYHVLGLGMPRQDIVEMEGATLYEKFRNKAAKYAMKEQAIWEKVGVQKDKILIRL